MEPLRYCPDVLVLGAGGPLAAAWMRGLLGGLREASGIDVCESEYLVGTSAGALVAAALAAGREADAAADAIARWADLATEAGADAGGAEAAALANEPPNFHEVEPVEHEESPDEPGQPGVVKRVPAGLARGAARWATAAVAPIVPAAMAVAAPGGAAARAGVLASMARRERSLETLGPDVDALGARFDGRLRIAAVDRRNGRRVMLGAPGAPRATVREAILASCAAPWLFAPVRVGEREYVDGGVWSPLNLDGVSAGRGAEIVGLNPTAASQGAVRAFSQTAQAAETLALTGRGARVRVIVPDAASARAIGNDPLDAGRVDAVLDAARAQGSRLGGR
jgi:NTE family protein